MLEKLIDALNYGWTNIRTLELQHAVGKHLFECKHFHHNIVNLHNISVYSELEPSCIEIHYDISAAVSENTKIIDRNNNWLSFAT